MMQPHHPPRRSGFTLLEVLTAVTLSATLMASSMVVMRSSHAAWVAHESDMEVASNAAGVLRHVVRDLRQAAAVTAITAPADASGALTIVRDDGSTYAWSHSGSAVTLAVDGGGAQPLAEGIDGLSFEGYEADGTTIASDPSGVRLVRTVVQTTMPTGPRTISSYTWVRSW